MKRILIVEDDDVLLSTLSDSLSREGFEIIKAEDGEKGLALALSEKPDLILLDILLPKMDGITLLKKIRKDEWGVNAEVIILTNLSGAKEVEESLNSNVYDYLVKTEWKMKDIIEKVKEKIK